MKKFLAMALAAVMVLALAACGSKNDTADDTGDAQDAQGRGIGLAGQAHLRPPRCRAAPARRSRPPARAGWR